MRKSMKKFLKTHNAPKETTLKDIVKDAKLAFYFAADIIQGRWPEAEPTIAKNAEWACCYAQYVIKGRWPEAEPTIAKDPYFAKYYIRYAGKKFANI